MLFYAFLCVYMRLYAFLCVFIEYLEIKNLVNRLKQAVFIK